MHMHSRRNFSASIRMHIPVCTYVYFSACVCMCTYFTSGATTSTGIGPDWRSPHACNVINPFVKAGWCVCT
jgi:hypothetical protein